MVYTIDNIPARIDWEVNGDLARTLQNAKNLLMAHKGEVPYSRNRGLNPDVYDVSMKRLKEVLLEEMRRVMILEPDVEVVAARADMSEGFLLLEVDLQIDDDMD